jgi:hypothetical protein
VNLKKVGRRLKLPEPFAIIVFAFVAAACSGPDRSGTSELPATPPAAASAPTPTLTDAGGRCKPFAGVFDQLVACERSNGTLDSFASPNITWRVRYFVRYSEMPCHEAPTVEESYVYHAVADDLNGDQDLDASQRTAIRNAMFEGERRCQTTP